MPARSTRSSLLEPLIATRVVEIGTFTDPRFIVSLVPIGDGLAIAQKR